MRIDGVEQGQCMRSIVRCVLIGWCALLGACHGSSDDPPAQPTPPGPPVGLDARPSNTACVAPAKAGNAGATIALQRAFPNLTFNQPLAMLQAPGDNSRWFVLEKTGAVRVFANTPNVASATTFATLTVNAASEGGLLGMAFHPSFASNGQVFLSTTEGSPMVSVIARYTVNAGGATLNTLTRDVILRLNQPFDNHKGGNLAFGPDGYLYIGFGDGGSGGDPQGHSQNTTDMLGDMLRIDVDHGAPYTIPLDNPFAGGNRPICSAGANANSCPEIYAFGFRNPWRWSFDSATGELWVGDVGQSAREEIDRVARGGNYGWNCREGTIAYTSPGVACAALPLNGFASPVHDYDRNQGISVTGGYVYRGTALPALVGRYLFADYGSGKIWRLVGNGSGGFTSQELLDTTLSISSFGQGNDGELYVIDIAGGTLHKIVDGGGAPPPGPPVASQLSATGCVNPANPSQAVSGMIPYDVAAPFWSDGATKERWLAIPNGTTIGVGADGDFSFPNGTVLMKHFRLNGNLVETRLFMRHPDGDWAGYSYEWNAQRTDATLLLGSKSVTIGGTVNWFFPSGNDCMTCHTSVAGFALGVEAAQLNHDFLYASTGRTANELRTLDSIIMFPTPLGDPALQPKMPDPFDATAPLGNRARAYLHTNCAQCHRANGPTPVSLDFRYSTALANTAACDVVPTAGDFGLTNARIIAPGAPDRSVLVTRVDRRDASQMPPLASTVKDTAGVTLLRDWITSLASCM